MGMTKATPVDGTVVVNRLGTVEDADDEACALLGYSKRELVGLHGSELIPPAAQPATAVSIDRIRHGEISLQQQGRVRRKDGLVLSVDVSAQMLPDDRMAFRIRQR